jgi:transposase
VYQNVNSEPPSALIRIEPDQRFRPACHECGGPARTVHSHTRKFVRDLDFGGHEMLLQVEHRKIWCDRCGGVRVEQLDFVDASQRVTNRLAAYAVQLCREGLSVQAVARHLDLDPKTVKALDKAALEVEFGQTRYEGLQRLAIDEIAVRKGHNYMTVVLDYDTGRVVWMGQGRQIETLDEFFKNMPENVRDGIRAVALDMWDPYINAVKRWCLNADIVFDLFHVVKAFNKVIDNIRNEEFRKSDQEGRELLKGSKYLLVRRNENLRRDQRARLKEILAANETLNTVYWLKDLLKHIWDYVRESWAVSALDAWDAVAEAVGHPALLRFARTLEKYKYGILNHCKHPIHTSKLEGVNNKIKVIKRIAYGFHDLEYFTLKVKQALPGHESSN